MELVWLVFYVMQLVRIDPLSHEKVTVTSHQSSFFHETVLKVADLSDWSLGCSLVSVFGQLCW